MTVVCGLAIARADQMPMSSGLLHFYNLEYDECIQEFRRETGQQPEVASLWNRLAQAILYRELLRAGALESDMVSRSDSFLRRPALTPSVEDIQLFERAVANSIFVSEQRVSRNPRDSQALYSLGVAYGLRGTFFMVVRKAWKDALRDVTVGRKLHLRALEMDPTFIDARLLPGIHDYLIGSLPIGYRLLSFLAGIHGDREAGLRAIRLVAERGIANKPDAQTVLVALYRREHRPKEAIPLLQALSHQFPRNYLFRLELAQVYGEAQQKHKALAVLQQLELAKQANAPEVMALPVEKIYYYRGNLLFSANDLDGALFQLQRVTAHDVDRHSTLRAWLRQGQIHDLKGQRAQAVQAYRHVVAMAPQSEVARESRQYLTAPYRRS